MCLDVEERSSEEKINDLIAQNMGLKLNLRKVQKELAYIKRTVAAGKIVYVSRVRRGGYDKLKKLALGEVLPSIGNNSFLKITSGLSVRTSSVRLRTFKKSLVCVECGLEGTHFWVECNDNKGSYHLNLYATRPDGTETLMTKDHIMPKSKGGSDNINNMQTMCTNCNCRKGNTLPEVQ